MMEKCPASEPEQLEKNWCGLFKKTHGLAKDKIKMLNLCLELKIYSKRLTSGFEDMSLSHNWHSKFIADSLNGIRAHAGDALAIYCKNLTFFV